MLRRSLPAAALVLFLGAAPGAARADGDEPESASAGAAESPAADPSALMDAEGQAPVRKASKRRRGKSRAKFSGRVVPETLLRDDPLPRPSGNLDILSLANPSDHAKVNIYNKDGSYNLDALEEIDQVLKCRRTDESKPMDPQLLTYLSHVYDHFGGKPLEVVSGFRNQRKQSSNHYKGQGVCGDTGPRRDGHRHLSAHRLRAHRRAFAAQLPLDRLLWVEFERLREASAPRLEAQEAPELS